MKKIKEKMFLWFLKTLSQQSFLFQVSKKINDRFTYTIDTGIDLGDFGNNLGLAATLRYHLK